MAELDSDLIVIGAGQAGLAAGYYLQRQGVRFAILDANSKPGGSWQHYFNSLRLFSQARYCALPGMPFPGNPLRYPARDDVIDYLRTYACHFDLPVVPDITVESVISTDQGFVVVSSSGRSFNTRAVISASGPFNTPHIPAIAGQESFRGHVLHAFNYQEPSLFRNQDVVVVGGGETAIQIAVELAAVARVTIAVRHPLRFLPQRILGQDIVFWLHETGYDMSPISLGAIYRSPRIIEASPYRRILATGNPRQRSMFCRLTPEGIVWQDGSDEAVDAVIFGTGYKPGLAYLSQSGAVGNDGLPLHRRGVSRKIPGMYFVGLSGQYAQASATLRGVGRDAEYVVQRAVDYLNAKLKARPGSGNHDQVHIQSQGRQR